MCQLSFGEKQVQVIFLHTKNRHDWKAEIDLGLNTRIYYIVSLFIQQMPILCQPAIVLDLLGDQDAVFSRATFVA